MQRVTAIYYSNSSTEIEVDMDQPKKSMAREVAAVTLIFMFILVGFAFFGADTQKVNALAPIIMGFCSPVAMGCLGVFGWRSHNNMKTAP